MTDETTDNVLAKFAFVALDLEDDYDIYFGNLHDDPTEAYDKSARAWYEDKLEEKQITGDSTDDILGLIVQVIGIVDLEDSSK